MQLGKNKPSDNNSSSAIAHADRLNTAASGKKKNPISKFWSNSHRDGVYSATEEACNAKDELCRKMKQKNSTPAQKVKAVIAFILHLIHIFVRTIWRALVVVAVSVIVVGVIGVAGLGYLYFTSASELPNIADYTKISMPQDSTIYDRDGEVIGVVSTVSRDSVGFGEISQPMKDAIVSIEDERFYNHTGIDFMGIARALVVNFQEWRQGGDGASQGASTITQQYVRNAYEQVGTEVTISRKLTEMMLAAQLENEMSKDDILNSYLNTIYFGNGCYGVETASKYYFGHSANTLDYYEAAVLASIINGPSIYDPTTEEGRQETSDRVNLVLDKMYSLGKLGDMSQEDLRSLKTTRLEDKLHFSENERIMNQPFYFDYVMSELGDAYSKEDVEAGGWQIYTTLSIADGQKAQEVIEDIERRYDGQGITGAIVDIDNETGAINAFCGGTNYEASQFNIATQGHLQTGSTLKPIVYAGLCEYDGYYMSDKMSAEPVDIGTPENPHVITPYIHGGSGTLKQGIVQSDNAMTIHVAQTAGMDEVKQICADMGIKTEIEDNVVTTIGGQEVGLTPLELASAYSTLERGGEQIDYWCITQITDGLGNLVYEHEEERNYAVSEEVSLQVIDAMKAAVDSAGWYNIPYDKQGWTIAAKTGTTNDDMDSWCAGFNQDRSVALWVGGRDQKITVPNSSYNTTTSFSSYFEKVGQKDSKKDWDAPKFKTEVPKMEKGQSLEDYMKKVQDRQLAVSIEYVSADDAADGDVLGVKNEGELINRGSAVIIQVARDMVAVPDFVGMTPEQVYSAADGLSVSYNITYATSGTSTPTVTAQSVKAGEVVAKGENITLDITILINNTSSGATIQQVPLMGTHNALSMLSGERDSLKEENDKLKEQIEGLEAAATTPGEITVPNVTGLVASQARQVLISLGFSVSYTGNSTDSITSMNPSAGTKVEAGSIIELTSPSTPDDDDEESNENTNSSNANSNTSSGSSSGSTTNRPNRNPSIINRR